jgi:hypothetical protein
LLTFPVIVWVASLFMDVASLHYGNLAVRAAFYGVATGVASAIIFAASSMLDYNRVPADSPARTLALLHGFVMTIAIAVFALDAWVRALWIDASRTPFPALTMSVLGLVLIAFNGFLSRQVKFDSRGSVVRLVPPDFDAPPGTIPLRPRRH